MHRWLTVIAIGVSSAAGLGMPAALRAEDAASPPTPVTICQTIDAEAAKYGLPIDFFTRLIWKESRCGRMR